jgi:hypothetical protein
MSGRSGCKSSVADTTGKSRTNAQLKSTNSSSPPSRHVLPAEVALRHQSPSASSANINQSKFSSSSIFYRCLVLSGSEAMHPERAEKRLTYRVDAYRSRQSCLRVFSKTWALNWGIGLDHRQQRPGDAPWRKTISAWKISCSQRQTNLGQKQKDLFSSLWRLIPEASSFRCVDDSPSQRSLAE